MNMNDAGTQPQPALSLFLGSSATMSDDVIQCKDCSQPFIIEPGEAKFFASKGMSQPKRCKPCRALKKAQQEFDDGPVVSKR